MFQQAIDIAFVFACLIGIVGFILIVSAYLEKGDPKKRSKDGWAFFIIGGGGVLITEIASTLFEVQANIKLAILALLLPAACVITIIGTTVAVRYLFDRNEAKFQEYYSNKLHSYGLIILGANIIVTPVLEFLK